MLVRRAKSLRAIFETCFLWSTDHDGSLFQHWVSCHPAAVTAKYATTAKDECLLEHGCHLASQLDGFSLSSVTKGHAKTRWVWNHRFCKSRLPQLCHAAAAPRLFWGHDPSFSRTFVVSRAGNVWWWDLGHAKQDLHHHRRRAASVKTLLSSYCYNIMPHTYSMIQLGDSL